MSKQFRVQSFASNQKLNMSVEDRRRQTVKQAAARANNKFSAGGKPLEHAPVTLAHVPPPRIENQDPQDLVVRSCRECRDPYHMRIEFAAAGHTKAWLKSTCTKCGRTWGPKS